VRAKRFRGTAIDIRDRDQRPTQPLHTSFPEKRKRRRFAAEAYGCSGDKWLRRNKHDAESTASFIVRQR
jgi:hypothetical protein